MGVLWHGSEPIGDLPAVFESIRAQGLKFVLATNNSGSTIPEYQEKLANMGVQVSPEQVLTSADATFAYIRDNTYTEYSLYCWNGFIQEKREGSRFYRSG